MWDVSSSSIRRVSQYMDLGPVNPSVLRLQKLHISEAI
jgi:hypothetical protein